MLEHAGVRWGRSWALALLWSGAWSGAWACGSGGGSPSGEADREAPVEGAPEATRDVSGADGITYQMVETAGGVAMEAVTASEVQTVSCPSRTCNGLCDDCALRACQAAGELAEACDRLVRDCNATCSCDPEGFSPGSCGLPVCATSRNLCYFAPDQPQAPAPIDPEPGLSPSAPSGGERPPSAVPAPSAGAARPGG